MTHPASLITISRLACVSLTAAAACTVMTLAPTSDSTWAQTGVLATGCPHISERRTELGCYTTAVEIIGELPQLPLYWHLDNYPTRAAAEAAKQARGTVVESLGKVWLFTIADADWRPAGGKDRAAPTKLRRKIHRHLPGSHHVARVSNNRPPPSRARGVVYGVGTSVRGNASRQDGRGSRRPGSHSSGQRADEAY